jgi:flagellar hook protein FlgE
MQRSLYSGVSGLTNHQLILDATANNLSNVSTYGFKASRVSFATALNQTQSNGTAPSGGLGGTNPRQIGLGVTTSSLDVDSRQGSLLSTGRNLDLAIQGNGYFQVTDGSRTYYSRVGNFGFDGDNTLVDLGTGRKLVGIPFSETGQRLPSGPLTNFSTTIPSRATSQITMQGNLDATSPALQGESLQMAFPLVSRTTGTSAGNQTKLSDLTIFQGNAAAPSATSGDPLDDVRNVHLFGTKPDGTSWSAAIQINPYSDTVSNLMDKINASLVEGNSRFGVASLDSGNIIVDAVGTGDGFSIFMGDAIPVGATGAEEIATADAAGGLTDSTGVVYDALTNPLNLGGANVPVGVNGRLAPTFVMPANDYSGAAFVGRSVTVTVSVAGNPVGTISIPAADYSDPTVGRTFTLSSFPQVTAGQAISYDISGDMDLTDGGNYATAEMTWSTNVIQTTNVDAMTDDDDGDGVTNMYDAGATGEASDPNAWQYNDDSNSSFAWYRSRFVPDVVTSTIEVYDALGGKHSVETRMFRTGAKADPADPTRMRNSWDMLMSINPKDGAIGDDLIAGMEFTYDGKFTGDYGQTVKNTTLSSATHVGNPSNTRKQFDWINTDNPNDVVAPSIIDLSLGSPSGVDGLTGFGSTSTATAVGQDGYEDGRLDNLSVTSDGSIIGLYTNGISRALAQLQLATFTNPAALTSVGANQYVASPNSGEAVLRTAGLGGVGSVSSGALEGSNVDIASEFTRLITAQRGFQVNARVIQTTDSVLQELAGLIR